MNKKSVCEKINIANIEEDGLITSYDLMYSRCYEITGENMSLMSEQQKKAVSGRVHGHLMSYQDGISVELFHKVDYGRDDRVGDFEKDLMSKNHDEKLRFLAKDSIEHIELFPQRKHQIYLFVTFDNNFKKPGLGLGPKIFNKQDADGVRRNRSNSIDNLELFESSTLPLLGLKARRLDRNEIFNELFEYINFDKSFHLTPKMREIREDSENEMFYENFSYLKNVTVRDQLVQSHFDNQNPGYLKIGDMYYQTINLTLLPEKVDDGILRTALTSFPFPFYMGFRMTAPNDDTFLSHLKRIQSVMWISGLFSITDKFVDASEVVQKEEIKNTKEQMELMTEKPFELQLTFVVHHRDIKGCMNKARMIENMCQFHEGMQMMTDDFCHINNFFSLLPGGQKLNAKKQGLLGSDLSKIVPLVQNWKGCKNPQIILQNNQRELLPLDFRTEQGDVDVPNFLIAGQPGQGKSWVTNFILKSVLIHHPKTFLGVIDIGGSYKKQFSMFKELYTYIEMDYREDCAFDYFSEKRLVKESVASFGRYKTYIEDLLHLTIEEEESKAYSESQKFMLEQGINALYERISDTDIPLLEDFQQIMTTVTPRDENDEAFISHVTKNLDSFTNPTSRKSIIFNKRSKLNLDKQFLFVDMQNVDQDLKFQAISNAMINRQLRDRMIYYPDWRQIIIFDEVWKAWKLSKSKEFQEEVGRKGRKNDTSIGLVSQFVKDHMEESVAVLKNSCPIHIIFKTEDTDLLAMKKKDNGHAFEYNENQVAAIKAMGGEKGKSSQFFLKWGPHSAIAHVEGSKLDAEICSTDSKTFVKYKEIYEDGDADMFELLKKIKEEEAHA
jgi:hypothetical protein